MSKEIWKPIKNYEGLYEVSNLGRVKRVEKTVRQWNHQLQKLIEVKYPKRYLKFDIARGYNRVTLSKGNTQERFQVHQLVARHFIPNTENKPHVNHINSLKCDNRVENLEWCTPMENEHHKWKQLNKPFESISPSGEVKVWQIQIECARQLGIPRNGIQRCLYGEVKQYRGYKFQYLDRPLVE